MGIGEGMCFGECLNCVRLMNHRLPLKQKLHYTLIRKNKLMFSLSSTRVVPVYKKFTQ